MIARARTNADKVAHSAAERGREDPECIRSRTLGRSSIEIAPDVALPQTRRAVKDVPDEIR